MRGLVVEDKWERVKNYQHEVIHDFMELMSATGCSELSQLNRSLVFKQVDGKSISFDKFDYRITKTA